MSIITFISKRASFLRPSGTEYEIGFYVDVTL